MKVFVVIFAVLAVASIVAAFCCLLMVINAKECIKENV